MNLPNWTQKHILIVDGNNIAYRAYFSHKHLSYQGTNTALLYGFITILTGFLKTFKTRHVIVCWDSRKSKHRKELLPGYKAHRKPNIMFNPEEFFPQRETLFQMLTHLGVPQLYSEGMEADDLIYYATRKMRRDNNVTIVSTDKDFTQLLSDKTNIWYDNGQTKMLLTLENAHKKYGIRPDQFVDYLILTGDKSDNIPGYGGIGEVRATNFLVEFGSIKNFLNTLEHNHSLIAKDKLRQVYKRNRLLIDLPLFYRRFVKKDLPENALPIRPEYDLIAYLRLCNQFGLATLKRKKVYKRFKKRDGKGSNTQPG